MLERDEIARLDRDPTRGFNDRLAQWERTRAEQADLLAGEENPEERARIQRVINMWDGRIDRLRAEAQYVGDAELYGEGDEEGEDWDDYDEVAEPGNYDEAVARAKELIPPGADIHGDDGGGTYVRFPEGTPDPEMQHYTDVVNEIVGPFEPDGVTGYPANDAEYMVFAGGEGGVKVGDEDVQLRWDNENEVGEYVPIGEAPDHEDEGWEGEYEDEGENHEDGVPLGRDLDQVSGEDPAWDEAF